MKCRLCGNEIQSIGLVNAEVDINTVYNKYQKIPKNMVELYWCTDCYFGQIESELKDEYYAKYNLLNVGEINLPSGGQSKRHEKYLRQALIILKGYIESEEEDTLLDIGCGHGSVMDYAKDYFDEVEGLESSEYECEIAEKKGHKVYHEFFTETWGKKNSYSAVVSTQVWEHLENPVGLMKRVYEILKPGGVAYFDVPSMDFKMGEYYDIFQEHINYWTVISFANLLSRSGFEVLSIGKVLDGNHIAAYARKEEVKVSFEQRLNRDVNLIKEWSEKGLKIGIYGAGIKGRIFVKNIIDYSNVVHIFDADEQLENLYLANCPLKIEKPTEETIGDCDTIIITAIQFKKEIENSLREKYNFKGMVDTI